MSNFLKQAYYIVYLKNWLKPQIFPVYFLSKAAAKRAMLRVPKRKRPFYEIVKGSKLGEFNYTYVFKLGSLGKEFTKYDYPKELDTEQKRKNHRTIMRRRLRRMGMLTPIGGKYHVKKQRPQGRLIKNRQRVANSPHTLALAFRLERKPKRYYYIIINKHISGKKGILFDVYALRVDMQNKSLKTLNIQVKTTDVIIPYLLTEVIKLYGNRNLLDRCRAEGIKFNHSKPQRVLKELCENMPGA